MHVSRVLPADTKETVLPPPPPPPPCLLAGHVAYVVGRADSLF